MSVMTVERRIRHLRAVTKRACEENARTLLKVSTENNLMPGIMLNLTGLNRNLAELRLLRDMLGRGVIHAGDEC